MKRKLCHPKPTRLAVVLVSVFMLLVAACSEKDFPFNNPLGSEIYGLWYADYQASGTAGSDNTPYSRVLQAVKFNPDGTGTWWRAVFTADDASKPLDLYGGRYAVSGTFDYTVAADGTITAKRRGDKQLDGSPMTLTFHFADGVLTTQDGGATQTLAVAPKDYDNVLLALENMMHGAAADDYNINDKEFTAETWHTEDAIYIYDGVSKDIKDENGNEGYAKVNLPWYKGAVVSNLPMDFCNDVTPENGWELVLNSCGMRSMPNGNFFALYNKYTGILRFFYYQPQGFSAGNDHLWQVTLTQGLTERYDLRYGIPMDKTVSAKNVYGLTQDGNSWADFTTPYVSTLSNDGFITPNAGWWAYDVDLSLYRSENLDTNAEMIRLQMRSWDNSHVSLHSTFTAESKGDIIDFTKVATSKSKGFFGKINDVIKTGTSLGKTIVSFKSGDFKSGIGNGIELGKNLLNLKSVFSGGDGSPSTPAPTGMITITTQGTSDTDGTISSSKPTVGIVSPTYLLSKDFNSGSTVGQGVWNLKTTPKIYTVNSANTFFLFIPEDNQYSKEDRWLVDAANWTFFDPSSVEVELNPNVFPEDKIEWMQVDAVSGLRPSMATSELDQFRTTLGMEPLATKNFADDQIRWTKDYGSEITDYIFNFVGAENSPEQTLELTYPKSIDNGKTGYTLKGLTYSSGTLPPAYSKNGQTIEQQLITFGASSGDDYIIEPQMVFWRDGLGYFPNVGKWNSFPNIAHENRADNRNGKSGYDIQYVESGKFNPNSEDNGSTGYVVGYDSKGKNGYPTPNTPVIDIKHIPVHFPAAEINVTLTIKMKDMASPIVFNRVYLPEYEYLRVLDNEQDVVDIIDRIQSKKSLSPKTAGHTDSYDFLAARITKCLQMLMSKNRGFPSQGLSTFAAKNKRWVTWYSDQHTHVITTEGADAYTAEYIIDNSSMAHATTPEGGDTEIVEYEAGNSFMKLHKLGKVIPKGKSVVIVADADIEFVHMRADDNAAAPQNIPNNSLNGANTVYPVADLINILKGRVDGAKGGTIYVLRQGDNGFGYYPYTEANMTEHTSFLFVADVQYPGGAQPAFVPIAFE